ncbi:MAG TPA: hypothetical protein VF412_05505 [Bdellovibrio sp.]|uniref:YciI family protein n=1 Tax=Bdellovibrio sp. TaxID=28201 RepID=UPI002EE175B7
MKFALLIYQGSTPVPGSTKWNELSETEQKAIYADYGKINNTPGVKPGMPLGSPTAAKTVRLLDGNVQVKDGTYLNEGVAGCFEFEAENIEAAIALASQIPAARLGGAIEVRPIEKYW